MSNNWMMTSLLLSTFVCYALVDVSFAGGRSSLGKFIDNNSNDDDDVFNARRSQNDNRRLSLNGISNERTRQLFYPESWPKGSIMASSAYSGSSSDSVEDAGNDFWPPFQGYGTSLDEQLAQNQYWDKTGGLMPMAKREGHQLSIVNPLDVLSQRMVLDMMRRKMIKNQEQIKANEAILKALGKRSGGGEEKKPGAEIGSTRRGQTTRRKNQRKDYDSAQDSTVGEFEV